MCVDGVRALSTAKIDPITRDRVQERLGTNAHSHRKLQHVSNGCGIGIQCCWIRRPCRGVGAALWREGELPRQNHYLPLRDRAPGRHIALSTEGSWRGARVKKDWSDCIARQIADKLA